ncbi:MAG: BrnT family toxin [Phormidesmis sp.]
MEAAQYVFHDPLALTRLDVYPDEERYQTIGLIGGQIILVVHTWPKSRSETDETTGRIISARKATAYERKAYEEGTF